MPDRTFLVTALANADYTAAMAPPVLDPAAKCQATLKQAMTLIRQAEAIEHNAEEHDDLALRKTALEPAEDLVVEAAKLLAPIHPNRSGQCPVLFAEAHLTELKARLAVHQHDCVVAQALLSTLSGPYLSAKTYYFAALCQHAEGGADSSPEDRQAVYRAAAAAVDHADPKSPYWASRAWALYADSVEYLPRAEDEASPPDVMLSLEHAVDLDPNNVDALLKLAYRKHQSGDSWEALALLDRAALYTPRNQNQIWSQWNLRITIAAQQHGAEASLAVINTAIARHPQVGMLHTDRLSHLLGMERHVEMAVALRDSLALLASDPAAQKNLQREFLEDVLRNSTLDTTTPSAAIVTAVRAMQDAVPDEPCLLLLRGRIERRAATTFAERFRIHHWLEAQQARHTTLDPFLREALDAERIAQHNHLAEAILADAPTDRERASARTLCTTALRLAESHLEHDALANSDAEGRILAGAAGAAYYLGDLDGDVQSYQRAVTYWQRYQTQMLPFDDVVALEERLDGLIKTAQIEVWLAQTDYLVSTLIDSDPETELAALHSVQSEIMGHIAAHLDALVKDQEYDRAVALYRKTAAVLSQHPLLEEAAFAFQNQFFRTVIAGQPFALKDATAMCGDNPSDPMLLLLVAYAHTLEPDTPATAARGAVLMDQAWKQQSRVAPSLRPLFMQLRLSFHTALLPHTKTAKARIPELNALADQLVSAPAARNDTQTFAIAAYYHTVAFTLTGDPHHTVEATRLANEVRSIVGRRMVESTPDDAAATDPRTLWLTDATTWQALIDTYIQQDRLLDAGQLYVTALSQTTADDRAVIQTHFFKTVVERPAFTKEDTDRPTKDLADQLWKLNTADPVLHYLHVRTSRQFLMAQNDPWTATTLTALGENQAFFERHWENASIIPPALQEAFSLERIWQHYYRAKTVWQELELRDEAVALLTTGNRLADELSAKSPHNIQIQFPKAWNYYWLGKITGELRHYESALAIIAALETHATSARALQNLTPVKRHEFLRNKGWCWFKKIVPIVRKERNYTNAATLYRTKLFPILEQLEKLPAGSLEATRDALSLQYSTYGFYADALDHERLVRLSLLPLKDSPPPPEVDDTQIEQANLYRTKALAVLDEQARIGYPKGETARSRACTLLKMGIDKSQDAQALTHTVLTADQTSDWYLKNLKSTRECHIYALRLASRLPGIPAATQLANMVWMVKYAHEQSQSDSGNSILRGQLQLYLDELRDLAQHMPSFETSKFIDLTKNDLLLQAAHQAALSIFRERGLDTSKLTPPDCVVCPPSPPK